MDESFRGRQAEISDSIQTIVYILVQSFILMLDIHALTKRRNVRMNANASQTTDMLLTSAVGFFLVS